jgi:hypothetical protein
MEIIKTIILNNVEQRSFLNRDFKSFFNEKSMDLFRLKGFHYVSAQIRENPPKSFLYDFIPPGLDIIICRTEGILFEQLHHKMFEEIIFPYRETIFICYLNLRIFKIFALRSFIILITLMSYIWEKKKRFLLQQVKVDC